MYNCFQFVVHFSSNKNRDINSGSQNFYCNIIMTKKGICFVNLYLLMLQIPVGIFFFPLYLQHRWNTSSTSTKKNNVLLMNKSEGFEGNGTQCKQNPIPTNKADHIWRKNGKAHWYQLEGNINIHGIERVFQFLRVVEEGEWRASSLVHRVTCRRQRAYWNKPMPVSSWRNLNTEVSTAQQWGGNKGIWICSSRVM